MAISAVAMALAAAARVLYYAARLRYGETVPFTGRTNLALLSHQHMRDHAEALFADLKDEEHAGKILGPCHPDAVRVQRIAHKLIRAAHRSLPLWHAARSSSGCPHQKVLQRMKGLDWEVVVVIDDHKMADNAECFPGAGKIVVYTGSHHRLASDAEITDSLAHEIGHVMANHASGVYNWLHQIHADMPILSLLVLPFKLLYEVPLIFSFQRRRKELEADRIGMMLIAAAGIDPHIAVQCRQRKAEMEQDARTLIEYLTSSHPTDKKRCRCLSHPKVMGEAMKLYKQVTTTVPLPSRRRRCRQRRHRP